MESDHYGPIPDHMRNDQRHYSTIHHMYKVGLKTSYCLPQHSREAGVGTHSFFNAVHEKHIDIEAYFP